MRRVFCSLLLLWLYCAFSAQAQVAAPPTPIPTDEHHIWDDQLYRWWWGYTPDQVNNHIVLEPGKWAASKRIATTTQTLDKWKHTPKMEWCLSFHSAKGNYTDEPTC